MKIFASALILSLCIAATLSVNCPATSYCRQCDTSTGYCTDCPGYRSFFKGPMYLSNNVCVAMTDANKPSVGASNVDLYTGSASTRLTANYNGTTNTFVCKSGYYAYWSNTTTESGCYASSATSDALRTGVSGTPTTTNCTYTVGLKTSSTSSWHCYNCTTGKAPSSSSNNGVNCTGTTSITNCASGTYSSTTATCQQCSSGYVLANDALSCIAATTATANCYQLASGNTACQTCDNLSYFGGAGVCVKSAFLKAFSGLLVAFLVFIQLA